MARSLSATSPGTGAADVPFTVVLVVLCAAVLAPLFTVIWLSAGRPWFAIYLQLLERDEIRHILLETLLVAATTAVTTVVLGLPTGLVVGLSSRRTRIALLWVFAIAGFSPFLVRGYAFIGLLGGSPLFATKFAVVLTLTHALSPAAVIMIATAVSEELKRQLDIASTLGAGAVDRFLLITLPGVLPALASSLAFVFLTAAGAFTVPALLGGGRETMAVQIVYMYAFDQSDLHTAAALSIIVTSGILVIALVAGAAFGRHRARGGGIRMLNGAAGLLRLAKPLAMTGRIAAVAASACCVVLVVGPLAYVVGVSFQPGAVLTFPTDGMSLRWYRHVLADPSWLASAGTTLRIGLVAGLISTTAGYFAAQSSLRLADSAAQLVRAAVLTPAAAPAVMTGVGVYFWASRAGLVGTEIGVALAHALVALPISYLVMKAGVARFDEGYNDMAAVLGAPPLARLALVRVPLLMPSFLAALLFSLLLSFDEVIITLFVGGTDIRTIAILMWSSATQNAGPELAVPSTILLTVTAMSTIVALWQLSRGRAATAPLFRP